MGIGMMIFAMLHNEIKNAAKQFGLDEATATAVADCIVEYAIADTDEAKKQAISRCFESAGVLSDWRGNAMAEAVQQVLDNAPTSIAGLFDSVADLKNLMDSLRSFEGAESEDEDDDPYYDEDDDPYYDEDDEDDDLLPTQRDILSAKAKAQPRDSKGRFIKSDWVEPERTDLGDPCLNLLYDVFFG